MKNKKIVVLGIIVFLIIVIGSIWYIYNKRHQNQDLMLYGNVDIYQISLAFNGSGRIDELNVKEGDYIKKDQLLARLNTDELKIQAQQAQAELDVQSAAIKKQEIGTRPAEISQARAQLNASKAQLENALSNLQRLQELNSSTSGQAITKQELDTARSNQKVAAAEVKEQEANLALLLEGPRKEDREATKAQYAASQANLALIQYKIKQGELRSPADTVVRAKLQEVGDMTTAQKAVYTLAITHPKWVRVYPNEQALSQIKMGSSVNVYTDVQSQQPIVGKVGYISSVAEFTPKTVQTEDVRTSLVYEVRVYVDDPQDQLKMGQPVTVKLIKPELKN